MIPIEILKQVTVIYTHGRCPDGLASAMILKDAFRMLGMAPRIRFLVHGTPEHKAATDTLEQALFCDFAPRAGSGSFLNRERWPIVLDHHVGAKELVESFGELGVYADAEKEPGVSGAVLALREVWDAAREQYEPESHEGGQRGSVRDFATCVGARDTWQTKDPRFQRGQWISKMLMSKPTSYWLASRTMDKRISPFTGEGIHVEGHVPYLSEQEVEMGRALFEAHEEAVRQAVEQCVPFTVEYAMGQAYVRLFVFQEQACGFRLCSDVTEALRGKDLGAFNGHEAVVAGFSYVVDESGSGPRLLYSLRGLNGFDVQKFATANGGGGHKAAAGFSAVPPGMFGGRVLGTNPYDYIRIALEAFLRGGG